MRLHPDFPGATSYIQLAQPVLHQSYFTVRGSGDNWTGALMVFTNGLGSASREVRSIPMRRGVWYPLVFRVRLARGGSYEMSVNGDAFRGISGGIDTTAGHTSVTHGGTWGLYMRGGKGDCVVYHALPWIKKE